MALNGPSNLQTDWGNEPRIIRMTTADTYLQITTPGYLKDPNVLKAVGKLQNTQDGTFQWLPDDVVLISCANLEAFFQVDNTVNYNFYPIQNAPDLLLTQAVPVSLTAFLANYTTPVPIIPAQPGYILQVDSWAIQLIYGTVVLAAGGAVSLQYNNTTHGGGIAASNAIAAADLYAAANSYEYSAGGLCAIEPWTSVEGVGLYLSNPTALFTGGTGSSIIVNVWYRLVNPGASSVAL